MVLVTGQWCFMVSTVSMLILNTCFLWVLQRFYILKPFVSRFLTGFVDRSMVFHGVNGVFVDPKYLFPKPFISRFLTGFGDRSMVFHGVNHGAMLKEKNVFRNPKFKPKKKKL